MEDSLGVATNEPRAPDLAGHRSVESAEAPPLNWATHDVEQRLGFRGGRYTRVNGLFTALVGLGLTLAFYAIAARLEGSYFTAMFCDRGVVPYPIVFLSMWSVAILFVKWRKLGFQRKALTARIVPDTHDFVLSPSTVDQAVTRLYLAADDPRHLVLFNRILVALSNLKNLGRVSDVDDILRSQAEHDEASMETSYALVRGFVWAIPVLGFIGTVLGLSQAISSFGAVVGAAADTSEIANSLRGVTSGLATAFETTLEALVAALFIQLAATVLHKSEEEFLDDTRDYCQRHVVNRLRMTPFDAAGE